MMVMNYAKYGSLRNLLNNKFKELTWRRKYEILCDIISGLKNIHEMGLMHKDFHSGNVVNQALVLSYITDFGLCKPVSENDPENIYGVIPYMAPETLSRGEYTQVSDIYSLGMVMLEVLTSYPPYYNIPHNANLVMDICKGLKPEIKCEIPQFLKEIMEKCWNFKPPNRPTAEELKSQLDKYDDYNDDEIRKQVNKQVNAANKSNKNFIKYDPKEMHPEAIYTSRLISRPTISECDTFNEYDTFSKYIL
jgi:serine/threonine protein kinase